VLASPKDSAFHEGTSDAIAASLRGDDEAHDLDEGPGLERVLHFQVRPSQENMVLIRREDRLVC